MSARAVDVSDAVSADATGDATGEARGGAPAGAVPPEARGQTTVAASVVERIAVIAAGEVPGVRAEQVSTLRRWFGRESGPTGGPAVAGEVEVDGAHAELHLRLGVEWPRSVIGTAREVQRHVAARVQRLTGVHVCRIDVDVTDLPAPAPAPMRVQ